MVFFTGTANLLYLKGKSIKLKVYSCHITGKIQFKFPSKKYETYMLDGIDFFSEFYLEKSLKIRIIFVGLSKYAQFLIDSEYVFL